MLIREVSENSVVIEQSISWLLRVIEWKIWTDIHDHLSSKPPTHHRMKSLSGLAQSTIPHCDRTRSIIRRGDVDSDWSPSPLSLSEHTEIGIEGKQLRGKTLFKDDLALWMGLVLQHQTPSDYSEWRRVLVAHWERGVEELSSIAAQEGDWIRTLNACLPN